jgi:hypothetical protein
MSKRGEHPAATKAEDRVLAEETTTLPEGTVLSVYCMRIGKLGHSIMKLVALHSDKRVEMTVDKISPHNMRVYLDLVRLDIARRRRALIAKPLMEPVKPDNMNDFVLSMAYNDMFIFEALNQIEPEVLDADKPKRTKKMVERRRKIQKQPQVLPDSDAAM